MISLDMNMTGLNATLRNPPEYVVLGMLARSHAHGYDVCRTIHEDLGSVWKLGRSQIYALLARLERDGLVDHERVEQQALPPKKVFRLTRDGTQAFRQWVHTPVQSIREMRLEFLTKLYFCRVESTDAEQQLINKQMNVCRKKLDDLHEKRFLCATEIERRTLDYRIAMVEAALSWLDTMADPGANDEYEGGRHAGEAHDLR